MTETVKTNTETIVVRVNYKLLNNRTNRYENKTRILKLKK